MRPLGYDARSKQLFYMNELRYCTSGVFLLGTDAWYVNGSYAPGMYCSNVLMLPAEMKTSQGFSIYEQDILILKDREKGEEKIGIVQIIHDGFHLTPTDTRSDSEYFAISFREIASNKNLEVTRIGNRYTTPWYLGKDFNSCIYVFKPKV